MTTNTPHRSDRADAPKGFDLHDHAICVSQSLELAEARCDEQGLRFTAARRRVLELLLEEHRALGAYAILDKLRQAGFKAQPPVAYRALDFLSEHGFAHKIERLNAFVACTHPGHSHAPAFMVCRDCHAVAETHDARVRGAFGDAAEAAGFHIERTVLEAEGLCPACMDATRA